VARAYIETSVPSYYVARPSRELSQLAKLQATRDWWDGGCSGFDLVTSLETIDEAGRGEGLKAQERLDLFGELAILEVTDPVAELAGELVDLGIVPKKVASDALHIAVASVHEVDYLVTWNFKHIANPFLRERIRDLVTGHGYRMPVMCSPEELLDYNEND
jgi:predicted nucleic acid-binding protein